MLLAVSILLFILSLLLATIIAWANMMSDDPTAQASYCPAWIGVLVAAFLAIVWYHGW